MMNTKNASGKVHNCIYHSKPIIHHFSLTPQRHFLVDLGDYFSVPSPSDSEPESLAAQCVQSDYDMAYLPVLSAHTRDTMTQILYVGKAVMKEMYVRAGE